MLVRPPAVAGRFYPADPAALADLVDGLLDEARSGRHTPHPAGVIAPHAGYQYSGAVAAAAYAQLAAWRSDVTRVVLLGPAHFVPLQGMAVPAADAFGTPLGDVEVDAEARTAARTAAGVVVDDRPHEGEHSLETQLPFLQRALDPGVRVLPVLVGDTRPATVAALLDALLEAHRTVVVVSTDLSHYLHQRAARERDRRTAEAILACDASAIGPTDACGSRPLRGLLHHAAGRRLAVDLLRLATSADVGADPGRVVGYGAFLLRPAADGDRPV